MPRRGLPPLPKPLARAVRFLRGGRSSPQKLAWSVALGLFVGSLPLYGTHLPLCLAICLALRLDFLAAYLAANISNPLFAPFLLAAEVEIGSLLLSGEHAAFDAARARRLGVAGYFQQAMVGGLVLGVVLAVVGGVLVRLLAPRQDPAASELERARERTLGRYRKAPIFDRKYVAGKLAYDPALETIAALGTPLGELVDAGAGRGQLGLALLELGLARTLRGFDRDPARVRVAELAAGENARFAVGDLATADFGTADTILLSDVLHYLPLAEQDAVLARAARALRPGGRLLIREADGAPHARSFLTRALERLARAVGWHRGRAALRFRPLAELAEQLAKAGLGVRVLDASAGTPFANSLLVGERPPAALSGDP